MRNVCTRCNQVYITSERCSDYVHTCNSGTDAIDKESILVKGDWTDYTGTETNENLIRGNLSVRGVANKLWGTKSQIAGGKIEDINVHGLPIRRYRLRQHDEYIVLEDKNGRENKRTNIRA